MLRALREFVVVLAVILALAFVAAYLYEHVGGASANRAHALVFYLGGAGLFLFALVTRGAEGRAYNLAPVGLLRRQRVREGERALNPTGVLILAAVLLLVLGGVFDTVR